LSCGFYGLAILTWVFSPVFYIYFFSSQLYLSTLGELEISLHNHNYFLICFLRGCHDLINQVASFAGYQVWLGFFFFISSFNIGLIEIDRLTLVNLGHCFYPFFNWFYFQFNSSTLGWLRIELYNLFYFISMGLS